MCVESVSVVDLSIPGVEPVSRRVWIPPALRVVDLKEITRGPSGSAAESAHRRRKKVL